MPKKFHHIDRTLLYIFLLLFCCASSVAVAQTHPVVGTWDVTISGLVKGGGYLTFAEDNSIAGYIIIRPHPEDDTTIDFNAGFFVIDGIWDIDHSNHVFGFFTGTPDSNCAPEDQVLTVNSFSGIVKVGKTTELRIKAKTDTLVMTLAGAPADFGAEPVDPSGLSTAKVLKDGSVFREFFSIDPSSPSYPNLYPLDGYGVNYSIKGCVLLFDSGKRVALALQEESAGQIRNRRHLSGALNRHKGTAVVVGWDKNMKSVQMDITP
jgi:hypothetical protein